LVGAGAGATIGSSGGGGATIGGGAIEACGGGGAGCELVQAARAASAIAAINGFVNLTTWFSQSGRGGD